jgi:hypothetical protein
MYCNFEYIQCKNVILINKFTFYKINFLKLEEMHFKMHFNMHLKCVLKMEK